MATIQLNKARAVYRLPVRVKRDVSNPFGHDYREIVALDGVTLQCHKGDHVGIIGPNGSGKSTLLKLIGGVIPPRKGLVNVDGERIVLMDRMAGMLMLASVEENAWIKAAFYGLKGPEINKFVELVLSESGLTKKASVPLRTLSAGMLAKFNLAINSQIVKPITIMDEWIGTTDTSQSSYGGLLYKISREVDILLLASHNEALIRKLCNRIILLDNGQVLYDGVDFDYAYKLYNENAGIEKDDIELEQADADAATVSKAEKSIASRSNSGNLSEQKIHLLQTSSFTNNFIRSLANDNTDLRKTVVFEPYITTLRMIPAGEKVALFITDPVERIVDGFYQRKVNSDISAEANVWYLEHQAFQDYSDINYLATDLSSDKKELSIKAARALTSITAIRDSYWRWVFNKKYFASRLEDIVFIGFEESGSNDVIRFLELLGFGEAADTPLTSVESNDINQPPVSENTHNVLKLWCQKDYEFYDFCKQIRFKINSEVRSSL